MDDEKSLALVQSSHMLLRSTYAVTTSHLADGLSSRDSTLCSRLLIRRRQTMCAFQQLCSVILPCGDCTMSTLKLLIEKDSESKPL